MNVLFLTADYPPHAWSGVAAAVEAQALGLVRLGARVTVLVADTGVSRPVGSAVPGLTVRALDQVRFPGTPKAFDIVHVHSLGLAGLAVELRRRFGLRLVYTAHSLMQSELARSPEARKWSAVQGRLMRLSDQVVFPSEHQRAAALGVLPELESRSVVVPNAIVECTGHTDAPATDCARLGPLLFVGRFAGTKGIGLLAEVAERIFRTRPGHLVLVGGHGDSTGAHDVRLVKRTLGERCSIRPWVERESLDLLYRQASLVLVPSLNEPFGLVALEAMRAHAPVLAAAVGGLREVVGPESGGLTVEGRNPARWAEHGLRILNDDTLNHTLRQRGPTYVRKHFGPASVGQTLIERAYRVA